jgi:hypothetical protein
MNLGAPELLIVLVVLAIPLAVVVFVIAMARGRRSATPSGPPNDPIATLDGRLARGEISPDQYDEARKRLG